MTREKWLVRLEMNLIGGQRNATYGEVADMLAALRDIARYSTGSSVQPVQLARDVFKCMGIEWQL